MVSRGVVLLGLLLSAGAWAPAAAAEGQQVLPAPTWQVGDWWDVWYEDASPGASVHRARAVVVAIEDDAYVVALDSEAPDPGILLSGLPGFGRVLRSDLSMVGREDGFRPLEFPLVEGASWQTRFSVYPVRAEVVSVAQGKALIEYRDTADDRLRFTAVYDAAVGWLTDFDAPFWIRAAVADHGTDAACTGFVPEARAVLFDERLTQRTMEVFGFPPAATSVHPAAHDGLASVSLSVIGGNGLSEVEVVAPDGQRFVVTVDPVDYVRSKTVYASVAEAQGIWSVSMARTSALGLVKALGVQHQMVPAERYCGTDAAPLVAADTRSITAPADPIAAVLGAGLVMAILVGVTAAAAALRFPSSWRRVAGAAFGLGLFSRLDRESAPTHPRRGLILELLAGRPGLTTQELRHAVGAGWNTTVHHLRQLERTGLVVSTRLGRNRHWYRPEDAPNVEVRKALAVLRRPRSRAVYDAVKAAPGVSQNELAEALGVHHTTILYHTRRLLGAGHLEMKRERGVVRYFARDKPVRA